MLEEVIGNKPKCGGTAMEREGERTAGAQINSLRVFEVDNLAVPQNLAQKICALAVSGLSRI